MASPKFTRKGPRPRPVSDRLMDHVQMVTETGCWIWMGSQDGNGYGRIQIGTFKHPKFRRVHIVSYEHAKGKVPSGLELDHLCRVRCCFNPHHLEPVTSRENIRRGRAGKHNKEKTHCRQGHPFDEANTLVYFNRAGRHRGCKTCIKHRYRP